MNDKKKTGTSDSDSGEITKGILLPDGTTIEDAAVKIREKNRKTEDQNYVPVIIKRSDETRRHPDDALENAIHEGIEQLERPTLSLLISAIAAGLIVGFSPMAVAVITVAAMELQAPEMVTRIATAIVYPAGFIMCILSGAQLFTEHTATALYPVLDQKKRVRDLLRLWITVVIGNLLGAFLNSLLLYSAGDVINASEGFLDIGHHLVRFNGSTLLISAILAGWLMAMGAWLAVSSPRTQAQITVIYAVTFMIGVGGLHHSIAGSVEMFAAMFYSEEFTVAVAAEFIATALCGNLIGGSLFVALLNYAHIRRTNL